MATGYSNETRGVRDGTVPASLSDGRVLGGETKSFIATFDLSRADVTKAIADNNLCFRLPRGCKPHLGYAVCSVTMGATATIAVGPTTSTGKYRAAAVLTTPDVPVFFMLSAAAQAAPLSADEDVYFTVAAAALPGAGLLTVVILASMR